MEKKKTKSFERKTKDSLMSNIIFFQAMYYMDK